MTNEQAKNKLVATIERHFEGANEVGFPHLDLSEYKGKLNLQFLKLGGSMDNYGTEIGEDMTNTKVLVKRNMYNTFMKIGKDKKMKIDSVISDSSGLYKGINYDIKEIYSYDKKSSEKIIIEGFDTLDDFRDYYIETHDESDVQKVIKLTKNISYFMGYFESIKKAAHIKKWEE